MKATKAEANYRKGGDHYCSLCSMFQPPDRCSAVKGKIRPEDVCDYFKWWSLGKPRKAKGA